VGSDFLTPYKIHGFRKKGKRGFSEHEFHALSRHLLSFAPGGGEQNFADIVIKLERENTL
jgi:hypothetical protein